MSGLYRITGREGHENIQPFSELSSLPFRSFDMIYEDRENNIYVKDIGDNFYVRVFRVELKIIKLRRAFISQVALCNFTNMDLTFILRRIRVYLF